ncbi:hypothetical protein LBMAG53_18180 [Planctomycetota bacterium]|nr:hypothetical protein LBMAG53_18180 [Planctomycetota bacterium]
MNLSIRRPSTLVPLLAAIAALPAAEPPKVVLISLDGATPRLVEQYLADGTLPRNKGIGLLKFKGLTALQNLTVTPSLTAVGHVAIATGSNPARTNVIANSFHLVASPFNLNISGFAAPIGGYFIDGPAHMDQAGAEPVWKRLRAAGKKVVAATFPGADGIDVKVPGTTPVVQPASERTVDYTMPFGAFAGPTGTGFVLTAADFSDAPSTVTDALTAAGKTSFSTVKVKTTSLETFTVNTKSFDMRVAALDTTDDALVNYDTLVFFDQTIGLPAGPFSKPSTGPAYVKNDGKSQRFFLEGTPNKIGFSYFVSTLAGDLSTVRLARYAGYFIPRNSPDATVIANVDDINNNVGFWLAGPDFRFPERLFPTIPAGQTGTFTDAELEAMYQDQVLTTVDYSAQVAIRAITQTPGADLVLTYIEQPDGSTHQYLLQDPRQPTNIKDPNSILDGQDQAKVRRYDGYVRFAYQQADKAVQRILDTIGYDAQGRPLATVLLVSDHGFETFHTAVSLPAMFTAAGLDSTKVKAVTSGPAVNVYFNLQGREPGGTVTPAEYRTLQAQVFDLLRSQTDLNANYTNGASAGVPLFDLVAKRPLPASDTDPKFGRVTDSLFAQDSGDVVAILKPGYNFDGTQNPVVIRKGDSASEKVLSLPNFYGAHGYDANYPNLSAICYAAGPDVTPGTLTLTHNIDMAPTINRILGVVPSATVEGSALPLVTPRVLPTSVAQSLPNGLAIGDVTQTSAVLWTLSTALGAVTFEVATDAAFANLVLSTTVSAGDATLPVTVTVTDLIPGTAYQVRARNALGAEVKGSFRTNAAAGAKGARIGFGGDWRGELGSFPAVADLAGANLDVFIANGDTIYSDYPSPAVNKPFAETLTEFRAKHAEVYATNLGRNTFAAARAVTPWLASIDDHEVINDFSGGAAPASDPRFAGLAGAFINETSRYNDGLRAFVEYNPIADRRYGATGDARTAGKRKLYRYRTFGSSAAVIVCDQRSFRDAPLAEPANLSDPAAVGAYLAQTFTPGRTLFGAQQKADLKADLLRAQADGITWKFVVIQEPIQNLGVLGSSDRFEGYAAERSELLAYIADKKIRNVVFLSADVHGFMVNNLTWQTGAGQPQKQSGAFEVTTGAVAFDPPFGPFVAGAAQALGLISATSAAFYNSLPVNHDAGDTVDDKDDFIKQIVNGGLLPLGYDLMGLNGSKIPAKLVKGDYVAYHTYGWSELVIDPTSEQLTVNYHAIPWYSQADLAANTTAVMARTPTVDVTFTVYPVKPAVVTGRPITGGTVNSDGTIHKVGVGGRGSITFTVPDLAGGGTITITATSSNQAVIKDADIKIGALVAASSLRAALMATEITYTTSAAGDTVITIEASNGSQTATTQIAVTADPATTVTVAGGTDENKKDDKCGIGSSLGLALVGILGFGLIGLRRRR